MTDLSTPKAVSPPTTLGALFKRYLLAGLLIWVPLGITLWVLNLIVSTMDSTLNLLPESIRAQPPFNWLFAGVWMTLLVVLSTGLFATNFFGERVVRWWDKVVQRLPLVGSIYKSVKQVSDTLFSQSGQAFRKALLIQYPREGIWTIAFLTGTPGREVRKHLGGETLDGEFIGNDPDMASEFVSVYVPTTPNPTSGFFLMLRRSEVVVLDMSVDEALKYIISMGVVVPDEPAARPYRAQTVDSSKTAG